MHLDLYTLPTRGPRCAMSREGSALDIVFPVPGQRPKSRNSLFLETEGHVGYCMQLRPAVVYLPLYLVIIFTPSFVDFAT